MNSTFTIDNLTYALKFPFQDPKWKGKLLIVLALNLGNGILPIIPMILLYGYLYEIMHGVLVDRQRPVLPEWDDFGKYFKNGLKLFGVYFVYLLPGILVYIIGFSIYMISVFAISASDSNHLNSGIPAGFFVALGVFYLSLFVSMALMLLASLVLPSAAAHMVARQKFSAGFDFPGMWKVVRANIWGYLLGLAVMYGVAMILMLVVQVFYFLALFCCLFFIVLIAASVYPMMVIPALNSYMYLAGQEKLEEASA